MAGTAASNLHGHLLDRPKSILSRFRRDNSGLSLVDRARLLDEPAERDAAIDFINNGSDAGRVALR